MTDFSTRPRRRGPGSRDLALLGSASLVVAFSVSEAWSSWAELQRIRGAVEMVRQEADAARAQARLLDQGAVGEALASRVLLTSGAAPPRVLADLQEVLSGDVRLSGITLTYGEHLDLEMEVVARRPLAYDAFVRRLVESPRFARVLPGAESRGAEVRASVRATYRGEALP